MVGGRGCNSIDSQVYYLIVSVCVNRNLFYFVCAVVAFLLLANVRVGRTIKYCQIGFASVIILQE
jgi:hypothetical protein